jgi:hypothetical protein
MGIVININKLGFSSQGHARQIAARQTITVCLLRSAAPDSDLFG